MKNSQKGFVVPLLIVIASLVIGSGAYVYVKNKPVNEVNQNTEKVTSTPNVIVFGSDDSIKNGQVLTPQQKVVKQIVTKATSTATTVANVKNCMNDFQCIVDAAKTCAPAKADVTTVVDVGKMFAPLAPDPSKVPSVMQTQTSHYEIRGLTNGMCVYYSKLIDIKNPNLPPEGVKSLLSQAGDMTCSYSTSDLVARLKNAQAGNSSGSFDSSNTPTQRNARQCREFGVSSGSTTIPLKPTTSQKLTPSNPEPRTMSYDVTVDGSTQRRRAFGNRSEIAFEVGNIRGDSVDVAIFDKAGGFVKALTLKPGQNAIVLNRTIELKSIEPTQIVLKITETY